MLVSLILLSTAGTALAARDSRQAFLAGGVTIPEIHLEDVAEDALPQLIDYSYEDLSYIQEQIDSLRYEQSVAHELAENARALGQSESSVIILYAKQMWYDHADYILRYKEIYDALVASVTTPQPEPTPSTPENVPTTNWDLKAKEYPVATQIWLYLKDLGYNDYVCAGILGNMMAEAGGQTLNIQWSIWGGSYYGICQWGPYYPQIWGGSLEAQLNFLRDNIKSEFNTFGYAYQSGFNYNSFLALQNEQSAARAFAKCYERCASAYYSIRDTNATNAYNYFVNN